MNKHIKLGVVYYTTVNELTGAASVVRSFVDSQSLFSANNIDSNLFSFSTKSKLKNEKVNQKRIKHFAKRIVDGILSKFAYGSFYLVDHYYYKKGRYVINSNFEQIQSNDILIFHDIFSCTAYISKCQEIKIKPLPFILVLHTNGEIFKMIKIYYPCLIGSKYLDILELSAQRCIELADRIVFVAKLAANSFIETYPLFKDKVRVAYNGINEDNYPDPVFDGKIRAITVGTVNTRKNQILQIEAIARVKDIIDIHLTVIGSGDKLQECINKSRQLGCDDFISFLGARTDVDQQLLQHNIFIMTSFDEGLPIAAIEATRAKLPLILTDVGGNRELLCDNGYLIEPNIDDLVKSIIRFSESTKNQEQLSQKSYKLFLDRFSIDKMISDYTTIINEVVTYER